MIELLFKGKTKITSKWVEGNGIMQGQDGISHARWVDICDDKVRYEVIPETVGRFTGLTDKNGTKIFEGDIVKGTITSRWNSQIIFCEVVYKRGCFLSIERPKVGEMWEHKLCFAKDIEVVGNIHDNPELLEYGR